MTAVDDSIDEPNETVTVEATVAQGTATAPDDVVRLTITDNDTTPTLTLTLAPASIAESGPGNHTDVTATLSHASSAPITVTVTATPTAPATTDDYMLNGSELTFTAGDTTSSGIVTLTAGDNDLDAPHKTVTVTGTVPQYSLGTIASAARTLTITDDDEPVVTLALSDATIREGETVDVTARLDKASSTDIAVTVTAEPVAPATTSDFRPSGGTLTFAAGQKTSPGKVTLTAADNDVDGPETKQVTITGTGPSGRTDITVADTLTLTIEDNDTRGVTLAAGGQPIPASGLAIPEGDTSTYTMKLDSEPTANVTIDVASNQTAVGVSPTSHTFTATNWQTAKSFTVRTQHDTNGDDLEATLTHTVTPAEGSDYTAETIDLEVTVNDDESPSTGATLSVNPMTVGEGAGRKVAVTGTLNRAVLLADVAMTVSVAGATATAADFAAVADFPPGDYGGEPDRHGDLHPDPRGR